MMVVEQMMPPLLFNDDGNGGACNNPERMKTTSPSKESKGLMMKTMAWIAVKGNRNPCPPFYFFILIRVYLFSFFFFFFFFFSFFGAIYMLSYRVPPHRSAV